MEHWTKSIGYPVITVAQTGDGKYKILQRRFLSDGAPSSSEDQTIWWISVGVASDNSKEIVYVDLKEKSSEVTIDSTKGANWAKFNAGQKGFFRVEYSADLSAKLSTAVESLALSPIDRLGVVGDAFALAKSGDIPLVQAMNLAKAFRNEENYTVWSDLTDNLLQVVSIWEDQPSFPSLQKFFLELFQLIGDKVGWDPKEGESDLTKLLRSNVLNMLGSMGDKRVVDEAKRRFAAFIKDGSGLVADLRGAVYRLVMKNPTQEDWDHLHKIYLTADLHEEKLRALRALGLSDDENHIKRVLHMAFSGEVRDQDIMYIYFSTTYSARGRELSWQHLKENWEKFAKKFGGGMFLFGRIIEICCGGFCTEAKAHEISEFFKDKDLTGGHRALSQSLEKVKGMAKFLERNKDEFATWLNHYP